MSGKITWKSEKRRIGDLKSWDKNPRKAEEKEKGDVDKSLNKFGLAEPIVINDDGTIIGGHLRISILKEKGVEERT